MNEKHNADLTLIDLLWRCTVRVRRTNNSKPVGTGFFVTPRHLVTCAHVIKEVGVGVGATVMLDLYDGSVIEAKVLEQHCQGDYPYDYPDLALLECIDPELNQYDYTVLDSNIKHGDELFSYGFTEEYHEGDPLAISYEGWGVVPGFNVMALKLMKGQVQEGFSGAPLLNKRTGAVCGLIKSSRDFKSDLGGHGVSSSLISETFKEYISDAQTPRMSGNIQWGLLRILSCAADNGKGSVSATFSDFLNHWVNWSTEKLEQLDANDLLRSNLVPSPIESQWDDFIHTSWRKNLRDDLDEYVKLVNIPSFKKMPHTPPTINGTYEMVRGALDAWLEVVTPKWNILKPSLKKANWLTDDIQERIDDLDWVLKRIKKLSDPDKARLCVTFLIFGSLGSGKTQFLRSRKVEFGDANQWYEKRWPIPLFLLLEPRLMGGNIDQLILDKVNEGSGGYVWQSLSAFDMLLSALNWKLVIVIDEFDQVIKRGDEKSICDFVAGYTKFDSLTYLFTIQDTQLDLVTSNSGFWKLYSYENQERESQHPGDYHHIRRMGGWMNLADFNQKGSIGYKILNRGGQHEIVELLNTSKNSPSPLEAQILLFLIQQGKDIHSISSLNFFGFVDEFWKKLIQKSGAIISQTQIKNAISCVAKAIVHSSSLSPPLRVVKASIIAENMLFDDSLLLLKQASLLTTAGLSKLSSRLDDESDMQVSLNYPFLWNQWLAKHLWKEFNLVSGEREPDAIALLRNIKDDRVQEGIWEFILLFADDLMGNENKDQIARDRLHHIWQLAFEQPELSPRAPCFAARWASDDTQRKTTLMLQKHSSDIVKRGALFPLMFFAMETPTISPVERFELLRPYYQDIQEKNLSAYFLYGAERTLCGLKKKDHLKKCLSALAFSHLTGCGRELAYIAWKAFIELHGHDVKHNLETLRDGYLHFDGKNAINEYHSWNKEKGPHPRYFREELLLHALDWSWRQQKEIGLRTFFDLLCQMGWYEGIRHGIDSHIANEMRSEANVSFGRHFRWLERQGEWANTEIDNYKTLIGELLIGKTWDISRVEELGYFMLRHTDFTGGHTAHIPPRLWEEVDKAHSVKVLRKFFNHYPITKTPQYLTPKVDS